VLVDVGAGGVTMRATTSRAGSTPSTIVVSRSVPFRTGVARRTERYGPLGGQISALKSAVCRADHIWFRLRLS
jgi:hypothetical protein